MGVMIVTSSFKGGGAEKVAVNLANQYSEDGMAVKLVVFDAAGPYRESVDKGVEIIDLKARGLLSAIFPLRRVLTENKPKRVICIIRPVNIVFCLAAAFLSIERVVFREASTLNHIYNLKWYKRYAWLFIMRLSYAKANFVVANSEGTKQHLLKSKVLDESKIIVIDNPVIPSNVEELMREKIEHPFFLEPGLQVILNVGRLHKEKNHKLLVSAFSIVSKYNDSARLIILGEGGEKDRILDMVEALGLKEKVSVVSFKKNPFPYYRNADLFVLSSNFEGFGNVVVEALSSGNPVISTDCHGGPRGILGDGEYGVLVPSGDVNCLAEAIESVLDGKVTFPGDLLVKRSQEYTVSAIAKKYWSVISGEHE